MHILKLFHQTIILILGIESTQINIHEKIIETNIYLNFVLPVQILLLLKMTFQEEFMCSENV